MRKIEPEESGFEMKQFKGRDIAFVSDWLTKKVFKSWGQTDKSDDRLGHLNTILVRGGGNFNDPIFKRFARWGGGC